MTDRERLLYTAARRHYLDGATMESIAQELGVSRPTVSRLLARAREQGIVRISLAEPPGADSPTAHALAEAFGVKVHLVPITDTASPAHRLRAVAHQGAQMLSSLVEDGTRLGVAWGVTTAQVARALQPVATSGVRVVQLNGAVHFQHAGAPYVGSLLQAFAHAYGDATVVQFPVPAFFDHASTREAMWRERSVQMVLREIQALDVALFGVGFPRAQVPSHVYATGTIDPDDLAQAIREGAVGDVCTVMLDAEGEWERLSINARATGPTPAELRRVPKRVCVVGDPSRAVALLAALRAGTATHLVCDDATARAVLQLHR